MAEVFRSTLIGAEGFTRSVAIKRILGSYSDDPTFAEMFTNEAHIASLLSHPNIVSVLDFDRDDDGQLFLVMELVEGLDLARLRQRTNLPVPVIAFVAAEVLRALTFAHGLEHGGRPLSIVHRDVSPHNILVSWDGAVKLSDFGIAKAVETTRVTQSGMIKGKVGYMSPEQVEGLDLDGRSDLFALGIVLHELLTGERLFGGAPDRVVLNQILIKPIEPPSARNPTVPGSLDRICMRLLERDLAKRYRDAASALDDLLAAGVVGPRGLLDLADILRGLGERPALVPEAALTEPVPTHPIVTRTSRSPIDRVRPAWPWTVLLLAALVGAGAVVMGLPSDPRPAPAPAIPSRPAALRAPATATTAPIVETPAEAIHSEEPVKAGAQKRKRRTDDGILPPESRKRIGDGILRPNL
jgi:serine/threonine-protein kinase